jgi:RsiW-degrading membrane proteinase PrsW (M82 family)
LIEPQANEVTITLHRPSMREQFFFFTSGIVMSIPLTILAEQLSDSLVGIRVPELYATLLSLAILAPFIEEFAKAYPLFYRHGETERSILTLGFLAGLGFGLIEFFLYVFVYSVPVLIRLPVMIFHATNTSITAYGIAVKRPLRFYLTAVTLHSLINFFAVFDLIWFVGIAVALPTSYFLSWQLYNKTREIIVI